MGTPYTREVGTYTRITASGVTVLTSGPASIIGIQVAAVVTGQQFQLWDGRTTGTPVLGTCSLKTDTYYKMNVICNNGITYCVTSEDIDLTIYWNPEPRGSVTSSGA